MLEYEITRGVWTTPGGHTASFWYRLGTNDWNTISSTMAPHDEYRLPRNLTGVALDVGAYLGSVAVGLALDNPRLTVVAIEPVPDNAELIRRNLRLNGVVPNDSDDETLPSDVTLIAGAVGNGENVEVWYRYRGTEAAEHHAFVGNSSFAYDNGGALPHETAVYASTSLASLVERYGPIAWCKIDCEGAEFAFLDSPAIGDVAYIVGEWHSIRGHTRADLRALLDATHEVTFDREDDTTGGFRAVRR